jgi:glycosyltransferase involved in cell wall biosynthesis
MKVKVLESLAVGLPVVTTAAGAEVVEVGDGVVVATADETLATAATEILRDARARRQRGDAARETFLRHYTPAVATARLVDLYRRMAGG